MNKLDSGSRFSPRQVSFSRNDGKGVFRLFTKPSILVPQKTHLLIQKGFLHSLSMETIRPLINGISKDIHLYDLLEMESHDAVLDEVLVILGLLSPDFEIEPVVSAFHMVHRVYAGDHPLYRACNTHYHDLRHTMDAFLATARLIHGATLIGEDLGERRILTALVSALFHDTGYIQEKEDREGTGAKYTANHVLRSMEFLGRHGREHGLSEGEIAEGRTMILCTDIKMEITASLFLSSSVELLGRLLNAADLLAQMADRIYLEKLLFLYHEYKEGHTGNYEGEVDLLRKTIGFYEYIEQRLSPIMDRVNAFMISHLNARWGVTTNLYTEANELPRSKLRGIENSEARIQETE